MTALDTAPLPQHLTALARANKVRLARAALKRDIKTGAVTVCDVLRDVPWEADTMEIGDLLMSQDRWGCQRMQRVCRGIPVSENKHVGSLTARLRCLIIRVLGGDPGWLATMPARNGAGPDLLRERDIARRTLARPAPRTPKPPAKPLPAGPVPDLIGQYRDRRRARGKTAETAERILAARRRDAQRELDTDVVAPDPTDYLQREL